MLIFVVLYSCASTQTYTVDKPLVEITQALPTDIRQFGSKLYENPYIEPSSLIRGKIDEFFIIKISFNLPEKAKISVFARALKPDGSNAGTFYIASKFIEYWKVRDAYTEDDNPYSNTRLATIQRSTLPAFEYYQNSGRHDYYLPLVASNPIPRPTSISVTVTVNDTQSFSFDYQLQ